MLPNDTASFAELAVENRPQIRTEANQELFNSLQQKLKKVTIDEQDFYIVEGDTLLDEDQLLLYASRREAIDRLFQSESLARLGGLGVAQLVGTAATGTVLPQGLLGIVQGGRIVRWAPGVVLSYCVLKNTFPATADYEAIVDAMKQATTDWEATCGIRFDYRQELDDSPTIRPAGVIFTVRFIDAGGAFIASAFFPNDPINRRRVFIDPSFFATDFDPVGILRHELGHVLGFRHEHIRSGAPPVCPDEDTSGTFDLTQYDPQSVMHYFCGGVGSRDLAISDLDRSGAQRVYGLPLTSFEFVDI
jgi:hypothetical protein